MSVHPTATGDHSLLERAVRLASEAAGNGGGPFGAVVAKAGEIVAEGVNCVTGAQDPTAHAEIQAIRAACIRLGAHSLEGCRLYASCEPCPMCLSACFWARLDRVVFAATRDQAAAAGFDDLVIYEEVCTPNGRLGTVLRQVTVAESSAPFDVWHRNPDHLPY